MQELYDAMWRDARASFTEGIYELDTRMDDPRDFRRGLSLVIRPDGDALAGMTTMISSLQTVAGEQHLYPASDLHVTVLPIISCVENLSLDDIDTLRYIDIVGNAIDSVVAFDLDFDGLTASPSCIMARGLTPSTSLATLRAAVRQALLASEVRQSMERRYTARTAHATLLRFRREPRNTGALLTLLDKQLDQHLGRCRCNVIELVFNDWYQRRGIVRDLYKFRLA